MYETRELAIIELKNDWIDKVREYAFDSKTLIPQYDINIYDETISLFHLLLVVMYVTYIS